ncbi:hypothetical protein T439DRAFT_382647 [Meredithblackwellia eburnea MCA 4105]
MTRMLQRCLACLRQQARPVIININTNTYSAPRHHLHAFAPSPPRLKKKNVQPIEQELDEFVEDEFDDIDQDIPSSSPSHQSQKPSQSEIFTQRLSLLEIILSKSSFELRNKTPSPSLITALLSTTSQENRPRALELLAEWHKKSLPQLSTHQWQMVINHFNADGDGLAAVDVLLNRHKYGVDFDQVTHWTVLKTFLCLGSQGHKASISAEKASSAEPTAEAEGGGQEPSPPTSTTVALSSLAQSAVLLLALERSVGRSSSPAGLICTIDLLLKASRNSSPTSPSLDYETKLTTLLAEVSALKQPELFFAGPLESLGRGVPVRYLSRFLDVADELEELGRTAEAAKFRSWGEKMWLK